MARRVNAHTQLVMYARRIEELKARLAVAEEVCRAVTDYRRKPQTTWHDVLKVHDTYLAGIKETDDGEKEDSEESSEAKA